jgi:hypothetical protein
MKGLRFITLALAAAFAISAVAAASASASPEWFKGGVKLAKVVKISTGTSLAGTLELENGNKVKCTSDKVNSGEIEPANKSKNIVVEYKGCTNFGLNCNPTATITTEKTKGELIWLDAAKTKAGMLLEPEVGTLFAEFECFGAKVKVKGQVIGEATPVKKEQVTGELIFEKGIGKGVQKWVAIEEKAENKQLKCKVGGGAEEKCALEDTEKLTFEEAVEIR